MVKTSTILGIGIIGVAGLLIFTGGQRIISAGAGAGKTITGFLGGGDVSSGTKKEATASGTQPVVLGAPQNITSGFQAPTKKQVSSGNGRTRVGFIGSFTPEEKTRLTREAKKGDPTIIRLKPPSQTKFRDILERITRSPFGIDIPSIPFI